MPSRLLILGLDGATWDVLTPLTAQGLMPNLQRLMQQSALLELNSTQPFITPVAWASFQTGCDPHEHGVLDYRYYDHGRRQLCLNGTRQLRRQTLLETIGAAGGDVVSLNLPLTFPPQPRASGIVVGGLDSPSPQAALSHVPRFAELLRQRGVGLSLKPVWKRVPQSFEELSRCVAETVSDFQTRAEVARLADELTDWRLMFVQFQTLDALQHRAWHLLTTETSGDVVRTTTGRSLETLVSRASVARIHESFTALDRSIGQLAELAERRGAGLVALSDHGFGSFHGKVSLPELLTSRGLMCTSDVSHRLGHGISRAAFRARKWLWRRRRRGASTALLTRPLEMLLPIDWRRSRAVALHGDLAGLVYLNTPARFGSGPLTTLRLEEEALTETLAALREARHPDTQQPLFTDVYAARERFGIDVLEHRWPEVIAIPAAGYQTRTKMNGARGLIVDDPHLSGTHRQQGILLLPAGTHRLPRQAEMRDVAPTLLRLLGIAAPTSMSGHSLVETFDNQEQLTPATCALLPDTSLSPAQQALVESRLRDLGYLD